MAVCASINKEEHSKFDDLFYNDNGQSGVYYLADTFWDKKMYS